MLFLILYIITMIPVQDALNCVERNSFVLAPIEKNLIDALNYYLAEDIYAAIPMPPFSQSAMDGYAISGEFKTYKVVDEIKAGDSKKSIIKKGEASRIFTGAMIPEGTTAIAKQEIVLLHDNNTIELIETVKVGTSIREQGEEIAVGDLVLETGVLINPAVIGLLSGFGVQKVKVFKKPKVSIVVTGNELVKPGEELILGKIYESNSFVLKSALNAIGINSEIETVKDNYSATRSSIENAIDSSDLVIVTGGISVGDYDFVGEALNEIGVEQLFYKVNQKPGKPLFYGKKGDKTIFALPGNPAAVLTCFYMYVLPSIFKMMGNNKSFIEKRTGILQHDYTKIGDRTHLLKAREINGEVNAHNKQSSAMLSSFVDANCLLHLPEDIQEFKKGEVVEIFMFP